MALRKYFAVVYSANLFLLKLRIFCFNKINAAKQREDLKKYRKELLVEN